MSRVCKLCASSTWAPRGGRLEEAADTTIPVAVLLPFAGRFFHRDFFGFLKGSTHRCGKVEGLLEGMPLDSPQILCENDTEFSPSVVFFF